MIPLRHLILTTLLLAGLVSATMAATWQHAFSCKECHMTGLATGDITGNLCLKCHASPTPMVNNYDQSVSTTGGLTPQDASDLYGRNPLDPEDVGQTSHNWAAPDTVAAAGAQPPSREEHPEFYDRISYSLDKVTCSRCHDPHGYADNPRLLRKGSGSADAMCLACHAAWNQKENHGWLTHPVGVAYSAALNDHPDKYRAVLQCLYNSSVQLVDGAVSCTSCHGAHYADSDHFTADTAANHAALTANGGDGRMLRGCGPERSDKSSLCQSCHTYVEHGDDDGEKVGCLVCHGGHVYDESLPNYFVLRSTATTATFNTVSGLDYSSPEVLNGELTYTFWNDATDGTANGYCERCHGDAADISVGSYHVASAVCTDCHSHEGQTFVSHGGAGGGGCEACHGHDAGYEYAPGEYSQGRGTAHSHSTHTEADSDDLKGPNLGCDTCHDTNNFPAFKSGVDSDGDGVYSLSETDVCTTCHSPGGSYDGLDDPAVGAKANWESGVYDGNELQTGKEKWCATCHDESPAVISSISAPNVIGDEDGSYIYGTGWGFYKTGHGLPAGETYPSKGGIVTVSGRPIECDGCHDYSTAHVDGLARTFDCGPAGDRLNCDSTEYRTSYRLKLIGGEEPMIIPWSTQTPKGVDDSYFRLCVGCHVPEPFTDSSNTHTNFSTWRTLSGDALWTNRHAYHLGLWTFTSSWPADYDFDAGGNSRPTCVTCHNVHGSTNLAMIRDGRLIDREPGQQIRYFDEDTTAVPAGGWYQWPPDPENVTLADSNGTFWKGSSATNLCAHCHAWPSQFDRRCEPVDIVGDDPDLGVEPDCSSILPPFQTTDLQTISLDWTGENGYVADGVEPNSGPAGNVFTFRVKVTSDYPELPWTVQFWIDKNDNGSYENADGDPADEKIDLIELDPYDSDYTDGKLFTIDVNLDKAGDNSLPYRFYAVGAWEDVVELPATPSPDPEVVINNNPPVLSWTGEPYFETDGVHPNVGGLGSNYEFRVAYADVDGECPASIQVWLDDDGDGYDPYEMTEVDAADDNCQDGKVFSFIRTLSEAETHYRFYATDGIDEALTDAGPVGDNRVAVQATANNPPVLGWVAESCLSDGVKPALGLATGDFEFKVRYTDSDGDAPTSIKVWVDLNDNGTVEAGEEQDLIWIDDGDENYTDGEIFAHTWAIDEADAGVHEFVFRASGGGKDAVGEPSTTDPNRVVTIVGLTDTVGVRQGLGETGPVWYNSIQAAIDPSGSLDYNSVILVYEGLYNENVVLDRSGFPRDNNITLRAVCGPELTVIQGRDDDDDDEPDGIAVHFNEVTNPVIDGFTITGGTQGIVLFHSSATIKNCIIEGNGRGISSGNDIGHLAMENTIVQNNVGTGGGAGIYLYGGSYQHTISGSLIKNNRSSGGFGGGIYLVNSGSGKGLAIEDTTISGNTAVSGGGIYLTYSELNVDRSILGANTSTGTGVWEGGGGLYMKESSSVTMINSNVVDNSAYQYGAGIHLWGPNATGSLDMANCTVSNNGVTDAGTGNGGGVYNAGSNVSVHNSIVWNNRAGSGHEVFNGYGTTSITWSDVLDNSEALSVNNGSITTDVNCIEADPFFVDSSNGDYHLMSISPAIDQGTAAGAPADDLDGNARDDGSPDMGAFEAAP